MNTVKIESGKIYAKSDLCEREDVFLIVDKIPHNYFVWNIGDNMGHDEYIPICQDLKPGDPDSYDINTETLKAVKLPTDEVKALRSAAHLGIVDKKTAERALTNKRKGYWSDRKRESARKTIDIFNRITE